MTEAATSPESEEAVPTAPESVTEAAPNHGALSDADFLELDFPEEVTEPVATEEVASVEEATEDAAIEGEPATEEVAEVPVTEGAEDLQVEGSEATPGEEGAVDFEAAYKQLTAPFKANGTQMQIESVEDAIQLMQMGAGYNKKMASLRPALKTLKMLENAGLMAGDNLNFLVDLHKKEPKAIAKFLKDSGVDPMDLDLDVGNDYSAKDHTVSDAELDMDTVLAEIKGTDSYDKTLGIITTQWDSSSKAIITSNPEVLKALNGHVANGVYDLISSEMERDKALGRLAGLSDIDAYRKVGDAIEARGGFANLGGTPEAKPTPVATPSAQKSTPASTRQEKRNAAAPSKKAASEQSGQPTNLLKLSDEEFEKQFDTKFL